MSGSDVTPLEKWRSMIPALQGRALAPMHKEEYLASIVAALECHGYGDERSIDYDTAKRLAYGCYRKGFLLSPIERLFLSVAVYPSFSPFSEDDVEEKRFHERLCQEAIASLPKKYYLAAFELLCFIVETLNYLGMHTRAREITAMANELERNRDRSIHYAGFHGRIDFS